MKNKKNIFNFDTDSEDEQIIKQYNLDDINCNNNKRLKIDNNNIDNRSYNNKDKDNNKAKFRLTPSKSTPSRSPRPLLVIEDEDEEEDETSNIIINSDNNSISNNSSNISGNDINGQNDNIFYGDDINYEIIDDYSNDNNNNNNNCNNNEYLNNLYLNEEDNIIVIDSSDSEYEEEEEEENSKLIQDLNSQLSAYRDRHKQESQRLKEIEDAKEEKKRKRKRKTASTKTTTTTLSNSKNSRLNILPVKQLPPNSFYLNKISRPSKSISTLNSNGPWIETLSFMDLISIPGMLSAIVTGFSISIKWVTDCFEKAQGNKIPITFIKDYDQKKERSGSFPIPFTNCTIIHPVLSENQIFHAKLMVLVYSNMVRIVVSSANPTSYEYSNLSQSIWYQDFYKFNNINNSNSSSPFQSPSSKFNKTTTTTTTTTTSNNNNNLKSLPSSPSTLINKFSINDNSNSSPYKLGNQLSPNNIYSKSLPSSPLSSSPLYSPYKEYSSQPTTPSSSPYRLNTSSSQSASPIKEFDLNDLSFKTTLKYFLKVSGYNGIGFLDEFNFSTCKAQLIISVPGVYRHSSNRMGLERLRYHVNNYYRDQELNTVYNGDDELKKESFQKIFYYQASSVGTSLFFKQAFCSTFQTRNNTTSINRLNNINNNENQNKSFHIIYPTDRWVKKTCAKQKSNILSLSFDTYNNNKFDFSYFQIKHGYRKEIVSHSKIIVGVNKNQNNNNQIKYDWCYSGSHNISSSAWGSPLTKVSDLTILNYEMGILLVNDSPSLNDNSIPPWLKNVPFQIPSPNYHYNERPYINNNTFSRSYFKKNR